MRNPACRQEPLPLQLAAMNNLMINVQLLTIEAAVTQKKDYIYQAAMLDPHTSSELSIDEIVHLCDDLIDTTVISAEIFLIKSTPPA